MVPFLDLGRGNRRGPRRTRRGHRARLGERLVRPGPGGRGVRARVRRVRRGGPLRWRRQRAGRDRAGPAGAGRRCRRRGDRPVEHLHRDLARGHAVGARRVPVEPDPETYNIDPSRVEAAITPRTRAIVAVHLYGQPADMDAISSVASARGLRVVEDAAQAHGASYKGRRAGCLGDAAAWSFYPAKNLGALGRRRRRHHERRRPRRSRAGLAQLRLADEVRQRDPRVSTAAWTSCRPRSCGSSSRSSTNGTTAAAAVAARYLDDLRGTALRLPVDGAGGRPGLAPVRRQIRRPRPAPGTPDEERRPDADPLSDPAAPAGRLRGSRLCGRYVSDRGTDPS